MCLDSPGIKPAFRSVLVFILIISTCKVNETTTEYAKIALII